MEWATVQHLDLRHVGRGPKPLQPHAAAFHPNQAIVAVAVGTHIIEFDALTGSKISSIEIGGRVVLDNTIKLIGAGAIAFHPTLEWIFVGDRRGALLAWDVSTERPNMIGICCQNPIFSLFAPLNVRSSQAMRLRGRKHGAFPGEGGRKLRLGGRKLEKFQGRGSGTFLKRIEFPGLEGLHLVFEKLRMVRVLINLNRGHLEIHKAQALSDRFAFCGFEGKTFISRVIWDFGRPSAPDTTARASTERHFMEGHAKNGPISRLPLITISDVNHHLRDLPVCQPFHLELNFFNKENRVLHYPVRAFYVDGVNLMAYNLCSGVDNLYKKLVSSVPAHIECNPNHMLYSSKQHIFLVSFELSGTNGTTHEVVLYWEQTDSQSVNNKGNTIKGRDAAFVGPSENQYAILDDDKASVALYTLPGVTPTLPGVTPKESGKNVGALDVNSFADTKSASERVLVGVLNDRLLFASPTDINPRQKKGIEIRSCLVGLLEPLLIGFATMQQNFEQKLDLAEILYQISSRFDSLRITPRSLDILAKGSPVCGNLAVSLSQAGPQFTQVTRCLYSIKALRFSTALSVLKDEFLRSRDYPQCPPTSHLFHRFRQLGYACIKYGQFDSAKETFEVIADYESMLDLFICHLNPSAMRRLAQKLEDAGTDSELRRYCERILRVRSTGWTQGIFANFAAESMVPKGPEWGGGNWNIKTPTDLKDIPEWELAAEVMPYMKTSDGSIPSTIADHIGVYLGAVKGRGNVVEVREGSLVKHFTAAKTGENKENGLPSTLAKSLSDKGKATVSNGNVKGDSVAETLARQLGGVSAAGDLQAKAEEEFKKPLYGADGSSSEEDEGTSKTRKIRIKIHEKPIAPPMVDVDKIKEATKQFKLGDGLGLPKRTKSLSGGSQDLAIVLSQPAPPPAVPAPGVDLFGTDSLVPTAPTAAQPATMVAASIPAPGSYISRADQNPQGVNSNVSVSNQGNVAMGNIGLPDGGVPPQAPTQPPTMPPIESIGFPDGGIPPQTQSQMPRTSISPTVDLSSLEASGAGKPPARPPSPPASVRPGQNQLPDALSCLDEAFLALAKDQSRGADVKAQATICAQYKIAVALLQEIGRLQKVQGPGAISAKEEMARLSRHLGSLPLLAKHRINCIRTAIKRNMEVQNYAYGKQMLELLLSKAPPNKQDELRSLIDMCVQRGLSNKSIDPLEDPSQFCAATLSRLSTIGHDICDLCGAKFSALTTPGCIICGMGSIKRSDASQAGPVPSPFG
ncbi:hypothetical protein QJS10_CPB19g01511 [Acorus calamus]|uniref:Transducin/WD40 repeat-like superfamily protein n=1 Tax=Acorus calamus TaxID=4465 RepID=A0AAV9CJ58_ACOCL|nr:hypothetical protein QJS10_CPB19g01511 [Acorus calamus]